MVWVTGSFNCGTGHRTVGLSCSFLFRPADPPPLGAGGDLSILANPTVAQDCVTPCFLFFPWYNFASHSSLRLLRYFGFSLFRRHILGPPPLSGAMAVVFLEISPVPYEYASFLSLFSWRFLSASQPRRSEVWEWGLKSRIFDSCSINSSWNRVSMKFPHFCICLL